MRGTPAAALPGSIALAAAVAMLTRSPRCALLSTARSTSASDAHAKTTRSAAGAGRAGPRAGANSKTKATAASAAGESGACRCGGSAPKLTSATRAVAGSSPDAMSAPYGPWCPDHSYHPGLDGRGAVAAVVTLTERAQRAYRDGGAEN